MTSHRLAAAAAAVVFLALAALVARWRAGALDGAVLASRDRERLSRAARAEELAQLLRELA